MEENNHAPPDQLRHSSPGGRIFEEEIQQIEINRENLKREKIRLRVETKENIMRAYLTKKLLVPSFLKQKSFSNITPNISPQKSDKSTEDLLLSEDRFQMQQARQIKTAANWQRRGLLKSIDRNQLEKWKLEMSSEERNSLLYGKQLKIGSQLRKIFISDQQIQKYKNNQILRFRQKPKSVYGQGSEVNGGTKMMKKHQKLETIPSEQVESRQFLAVPVKSPQTKFRLAYKRKQTNMYMVS